MNLDSVLDKAFSLLESSLEQKQAQAREQMELTKSLKQMDLSSQEKIQRLINHGALDKQELVNQGLLTQQELQNSGLLSRQEAENTGRLKLQETENRGRLDVQKQSDEAAYNRTKLSGDTATSVAGINARAQKENNWKVLDEFAQDGTRIGQRMVNPNIQRELPTGIIDTDEGGAGADDLVRRLSAKAVGGATPATGTIPAAQPSSVINNFGVGGGRHINSDTLPGTPRATMTTVIPARGARPFSSLSRQEKPSGSEMVGPPAPSSFPPFRTPMSQRLEPMMSVARPTGSAIDSIVKKNQRESIFPQY